MNEIINYLNIHSKWNNKQPQQQKSSVKCQRTHPHHTHTHTQTQIQSDLHNQDRNSSLVYHYQAIYMTKSSSL